MRQFAAARDAKSVVEVLESRTFLSASPSSIHASAPAPENEFPLPGPIILSGPIIQGTVFQDTNANGVLDQGETPLSGQTVFLDTNMNGTLDPGETSTLTDDLGRYVFAPTPSIFEAPVTYRVRAVPRQGLRDDAPGFVDVTVGAGQIVFADLGENDLSSISGTVFNDVNDNGSFDAGDIAFPNATVYIDVNRNGVLDAADVSTTTDAKGQYTFDNLAPGNFSIHVDLAPSAHQTSPTSTTYDIALATATDVTGQDFGLVAPDLSVQLVKSPTTPVFGGVKQKAIVRVTNVGAVPASGFIGVTLYASTDQALDSNDSIVGQVTGKKPMTLKPGQSRLFHVDYQYPTTLPTGQYYLLAQAVSPIADATPTNNVVSSPTRTTVTMPIVNLDMKYVSQPGGELFPGQGTTLQVVVNNIGNIASNGFLTFHVYASPNPTLEPTKAALLRTKLKKIRMRVNLPRVFTLNVPNIGTALGARYLIVTVDSGDPLGVPDSTNNIVISQNTTIFR